MPEWAKILTLIVGLLGWLATMLVTLSQGQLPDAVTLGVPAALWIALAPPITIGRGRGGSGADNGEVAPADDATR